MKPILKTLLLALSLTATLPAGAQNVGIGITTPLEKLHISGNVRTDNALVLWPGAFAAAAAPNINVQYSTARITAVAGAQANAISYSAAATEGQLLLIANEDDDAATFVGSSIPSGEARAFVYTNGTWRPLSGSSGGGSAGWLLLGNAGTVDGTNFLGTTDNVRLSFRVNNQRAGWLDHTQLNTTFGYQAGNAIAGGLRNTAIGYRAGFLINGGISNALVGAEAGNGIVGGSHNAVLGYQALFQGAGSSNNVAIGSFALYNAGNGGGGPIQNIAIGHEALYLLGFGGSGPTGNVAVGHQALYNNTSSGITAFGYQALNANTSGNNNSAVGYRALASNNSGGGNTAHGYRAGENNTSGGGNVAIGYLAGNANTTGNFNVAVGRQAGQNNTAGGNVFVGDLAGQANTSGAYNVAIGMWSGNALSGATASANTFVGYMTGFANTTAGGNTFIGNNAGINTNTGSQNTYLGCQAGQNYTTAANNTYIGWRAGFYTVGSATGGNNVFVGYQAGDNNATGTGNVVLGYDADLTGSALTNAIAIGNNTTVNASNKIRLGNAAITVAEIQVAWTVTSDKNEKADVRHDVPGLALVSRLQPVTYFYKSHLADPSATATRYTGLLAQDVHATLNELGISSSIVTQPAADGSGAWGIRYAEIVMPLIQSVQEQQAMIDALRSEVATLKTQNAALEQQSSSIEARLQRLEQNLSSAAVK